MARRDVYLGVLAAAIVMLAGAPSALAAIGDISTVAGNGTECSTAATTGCNDGGSPTSAELDLPQGAAPLPGGGFLIVDTSDNEVDKVSADGLIKVVAGDGTACSNTTVAIRPCGDTGPATSAQLDGPRGVAVLPDGSFLIADYSDERVREVSASGTITTIAGDGTAGDTGDNGPATSAELYLPRSLSLLPGGGFLIAEHFNCTIREVSSTGTITTVAGTGICGYSGDGGPATSAELDNVTNVAALPTGGFILSDSPDDVVREVSPQGIINIVAGVKGHLGDTGNGGPATSAEINQPRGMAPLVNGGFIFAEEGGSQVRMVSPSGTITTIAGNGTAGFLGDGGLATAAELSGPEDVALAPTGGLLIADTQNNRIRLVTGGPPTATITAPVPSVIGFQYVKGANVPTAFGCTEDVFGLGLASCDDNSGSVTQSGGSGKLNTSKVGGFTYTVTATSLDGQTATAQIYYRVLAPLQTSILTKSARVRHGKVSITLGCNLSFPVGCRGKLILTAKPSRHAKPKVIAEAGYVLERHKAAFTLRLNKTGRKLFAAAHKHRLSVTAEAEQTGTRAVHRSVTLT